MTGTITATVRRPRGRQRDPEAHQAILDAATRVLRERGYASTSIEAIAAEAGVGKQTIYRRWPTKAALVLELYDLESVGVLDDVDTGSFASDMAEQLRRLWRLWRTTAGGQAFLNVVADADGAERERLRDEYLAPRRLYARALIERAVERGELPERLDADNLLDMLFGFSWYRLLTAQLDDETAIDTMLHVLLHGATTEPPAAPATRRRGSRGR